uniref:Uncharacterized protein n=1 Tax=Anguilla anguilla TaxID=7936 RepID=A0A0E9RI83_ANGAN
MGRVFRLSSLALKYLLGKFLCLFLLS